MESYLDNVYFVCYLLQCYRYSWDLFADTRRSMPNLNKMRGGRVGSNPPPSSNPAYGLSQVGSHMLDCVYWIMLLDHVYCILEATCHFLQIHWTQSGCVFCLSIGNCPFNLDLDAEKSLYFPSKTCFQARYTSSDSRLMPPTRTTLGKKIKLGYYKIYWNYPW